MSANRRRTHDPVGAAWATVRRTGSATAHDRLVRLRLSLLVAVQSGVAAAGAWWIANDLLDNPQPLFAPAVAVGTIASSVGQRFRRTLFLVAGVAVGITLGDLLVSWVGQGHVQIGVIVAVSILFAVLLSGEGSFVTQVGGSAMVIAVLSPANTSLALPRFVDGLVGGVVGILVALVVLPLHPIHRIRRAGRPLLEHIAGQLERLAGAARERDAEAAKQALDTLRGVDTSDLQTALSAAVEVVRISPLRWHNHNSLEGWRHGAGLMMRSLLQSRDLALNLETALRRDEPVPAPLAAAVDDLAEAVRHVGVEWSPSSDRPSRSQRAALTAIRRAQEALSAGLRIGGVNVANDVSIIAVNTIRASGVSKQDAEDLRRNLAPDATRDAGEPEPEPRQPPAAPGPPLAHGAGEQP
ncbi:aromatic acid exporter family protein [Micromonospora sp. NPDC051300]|uniref:aromatic acid exporter family protein n=1 Tax=Micromonospora sp. NPDC051300 TaxID=3364286 RepID=UPI0037B0F557